MRIFTMLPMRHWRDAGPFAAAAETAGFDTVMTVEVAHDPFIPLAFAALATQRIELTPSIAVAFPRSPSRAKPGICRRTRTAASYSGSAARSEAITSGGSGFRGARPHLGCATMSGPCVRSGTAGKPAKSSTTRASTTS